MWDGSLILTTEGRVPVEDVQPGSRILAASGQSRPVLSRERRPPLEGSAAPLIRIVAGALSHGSPEQDVLLAPESLVLLDGNVVMAVHLVNGATCRSLPGGAAAPPWDLMVQGTQPDDREAYRPLFRADGFLHADLPIPDTVRRMPPSVATKRQLLSIAGRLGYTSTDDPDLHIEVDGAVIPARNARGNRYIFAVPEGALTLRLVSRVWVPAEVLPESDDDRRLGVCVRRLVLDGHELDLTSLDEGWDKVEDHGTVLVRWTKGSATVPLTKSRYLDVELYGFRRYWVDAEDPPAP